MNKIILGDLVTYQPLGTLWAIHSGIVVHTTGRNHLVLDDNDNFTRIWEYQVCNCYTITTEQLLTHKHSVVREIGLSRV